MKLNKSLFFAALMVSLLLSTIFVPASAGRGNAITIGIVNWADTTAPAHVVAHIIEEYFDKPVEVKTTSKALTYSGLSTGDFDLTFSVWLPSIDFRHVYRFKHDIDTLPAPYYYNAFLGLYVPDYMPEESLTDLADPEVAKKYDKKIVGIDPGSSLMTMTREDVMPGYGLEDLYTLQGSSGAAMTASLARAIKREKPVLVTLWAPHWVLSKYDVHKLKDPQGLFGQPNNIYMAVTEGFGAKYPEIMTFLESVEFNTIDFVGAANEHPKLAEWDHDWLSEAMLMVEEGKNLEEMAEAWVDNHTEAVEAWVEGKSWTPKD
ncbi:glycine betaine ABC transporter substrate-binding protein [Candidatus Bipolaricaulota bacterium]|nr:glycine betaine ABC transporter substrate-binding protein [Candidatus Bipolaricaulota bacterium]